MHREYTLILPTDFISKFCLQAVCSLRKDGKYKNILIKIIWIYVSLFVEIVQKCIRLMLFLAFSKAENDSVFKDKIHTSFNLINDLSYVISNIISGNACMHVCTINGRG